MKFFKGLFFALGFTAILFWIIFFCAKVAHSEEERWYIAPKVQLINFDDDNMNHDFQVFEGLSLGYLFNKNVAFELETNYGSFKTSKNEWYDGSKWKEAWTTLNLQLRYPLNRKFTIYAIGGIGRSFFFDKKMQENERLNNPNSIALKYGGGIEYNLNKTISICGEGAYKYSDTGENSSIDTWGWTGSIFLKLKF